MKRLLACFSVVALTTTAASALPTSHSHAPVQKKPPAHAQPAIKVAPADEYFGKLKLSILGIRNTINDVGANIDVDPARWSSLQNKANFAEDAIRDWEHKYPRDTWLAKTVFALERMYAKIDSNEGRAHSLAAMNWLVRDFPATYYGRLGKREIAEHRVGHPMAVSSTGSEPVLQTVAAPKALSSTAPNP